MPSSEKNATFPRYKHAKMFRKAFSANPAAFGDVCPAINHKAGTGQNSPAGLFFDL
jgi:hypothetical protein